MSKQSGHTRAIGTVDDLKLYFDKEWGFLARMLTGITSKRFWKDPAFEGSHDFPPHYQVPFFSLSMLLKEVCSL